MNTMKLIMLSKSVARIKSAVEARKTVSGSGITKVIYKEVYIFNVNFQTVFLVPELKDLKSLIAGRQKKEEEKKKEGKKAVEPVKPEKEGKKGFFAKLFGFGAAEKKEEKEIRTVNVTESDELKKLVIRKIQAFKATAGRSPSEREIELIAESSLKELQEKKIIIPIKREAIKPVVRPIVKPVVKPVVEKEEKKKVPEKFEEREIKKIEKEKEVYIPRRYRRFIRKELKGVPEESSEYQDMAESIFAQLQEAERKGIKPEHARISRERRMPSEKEEAVEVFEQLGKEKSPEEEKARLRDKAREEQEEIGEIAEELFPLIKEEEKPRERRREEKKKEEKKKEEKKPVKPLKEELAGPEELFGEEKFEAKELLEEEKEKPSTEELKELLGVEELKELENLAPEEEEKGKCPNCGRPAVKLIYCPECGKAYCRECGLEKKTVAGKTKIKCPECKTETTI